jgi:hypothetical protein
MNVPELPSSFDSWDCNPPSRKCSKNEVVIDSGRFKSSSNGSIPQPCNWLKRIVESKIFRTGQQSPLFS